MYEYDPSYSEVQLADSEDLLALYGVLDAANRLSAEKTGIEAWGNIDRTRATLRESVNAEQVFVARTPDGEIYAAITIGETNAEWGGPGQDGTALYFTKYMKNPAIPGDPRVLLKFVGSEAARRNKSVIRIDVVEDQVGLDKYYIKNFGFKEAGRFAFSTSDRRGILLECTVEDFNSRLDALTQPG